MSFEEVKEVFVDTLNCDADKVTMDASLTDDLQADSLDAVELNMAFEDKFGVTIGQSQILLFVFLAATAFGTMLGGPAGDRFGRKYVIWASILGTAPFSLAMPHVDSLVATVVLSFCAGLRLSSAFPAILVYAQELLPYRLGLVSGLFFGFAFGVAGIGAAVLGDLADSRGIDFIYNLSGFMPLIGLAAWFLPNLKK